MGLACNVCCSGFAPAVPLRLLRGLLCPLCTQCRRLVACIPSVPFTPALRRGWRGCHPQAALCACAQGSPHLTPSLLLLAATGEPWLPRAVLLSHRPLQVSRAAVCVRNCSGMCQSVHYFQPSLLPPTSELLLLLAPACRAAPPTLPALSPQPPPPLLLPHCAPLV